MRKMRFMELDNEGNSKEVVVTEDDVKRDYWPFWCDKMKKAHKEHLISFEKCWLDYKTIHWGTEI